MSQWDFFVSYTAADQDWAEWVAWQLEDAGYQVLIQAWDFVPGSNWAVRMQQGTTEAERTIALLSAAYLRSVYGQNEWHAAHTADPAGFTRRLLPVRVEDCPRPGLLGQIVTIDLFGHPADTARQHLLDAITTARAGRAKPTAAPAFPPGQALPLQQTPTTATEPPFPGPVTPDPDQPALHGRTRPGRIPRGLSRRDLSLTVALLFATGTGLLVRSTQDDNPTATSTGPAAPTPTAVRTSTPTPHRPRPPLTDHTGPVRSVVFSPDGETLASGSQDGTIRLWNIATQDSQPLPGGITVWSVAFSPDGRTLASGSNDHTVRLWDMTAGPLPELVASRTEHTASVGSVAFSLDRHTLASGSNDHTVRLWDATDPAAPRLLHTLTDNTGPVNTVAFSPDRRTLASGSNDHKIRLWDAATGKLLSTLPGHTGPVMAVAFSPDGETLASASQDTTIRLWNITNPADPPIVASRTDHTKWVMTVAFSPDGETLASAGYDTTIRLYNVTNPADPHPLNTLTGPTTPVNTVAFSPDGHTLAGGSGNINGDDSTVWLWNIP